MPSGAYCVPCFAYQTNVIQSYLAPNEGFIIDSAQRITTCLSEDKRSMVGMIGVTRWYPLVI